MQLVALRGSSQLLGCGSISVLDDIVAAMITIPSPNEEAT